MIQLVMDRSSRPVTGRLSCVLKKCNTRRGGVGKTLPSTENSGAGWYQGTPGNYQVNRFGMRCPGASPGLVFNSCNRCSPGRGPARAGAVAMKIWIPAGEQARRRIGE